MHEIDIKGPATRFEKIPSDIKEGQFVQLIVKSVGETSEKFASSVSVGQFSQIIVESSSLQHYEGKKETKWIINLNKIK